MAGALSIPRSSNLRDESATRLLARCEIDLDIYRNSRKLDTRLEHFMNKTREAWIETTNVLDALQFPGVNSTTRFKSWN